MNETIRMRLADQTAPRYTSYPTAADFSANLAADDYATWLEAVDTSEPLSLYLHVPYCRDICHYCGCHAKAVRKDAPIEEYRQALEAEIAMVSHHLRGRGQIARIAWGGGTPSILGESGLASILSRLKNTFDFLPDLELAIELDPRSITAQFARELVALGFNRVSLGVQDLDPNVQVAIGRVQPQEQVAAAVAWLRAAGIGSINFDLIYGLPSQTQEGLLRTCEAVAALRPDRVAFYGYAHLPVRRPNQRLIDAALLPEAQTRLVLAQTIADYFPDRGYQAVGIDHFALPNDSLAIAAREGTLHRNFQGYTDDPHPTLIGFGCSSISRLPSGYAQSDPGIESYKRAIASGTFATIRGHAFQADDQARADIIEELMCRFIVDLGNQAPLYSDELALLRPYIADGLVVRNGGVISMTETGRPFVRLVAAVFDRYRSETRGQFSRSI